MSHLTRNKCQHERRVMHARDPRCNWCGVITIDSSKTYATNPRLATLDHLRSRLQCETKQEYRSGNNKVIACLKCNGERDREFHLTTKPHIGAAERYGHNQKVWHHDPAVDIFAPPSWELLAK